LSQHLLHSVEGQKTNELELPRASSLEPALVAQHGRMKGEYTHLSKTTDTNNGGNQPCTRTLEDGKACICKSQSPLTDRLATAKGFMHVGRSNPQWVSSARTPSLESSKNGEACICKSHSLPSQIGLRRQKASCTAAEAIWNGCRQQEPPLRRVAKRLP